MRRAGVLRFLALSSSWVAVTATPAFAADGVFEINRANAQVGALATELGGNLCGLPVACP